MAEETNDVVLGVRVSKSTNEKILAEQRRIEKLSGIKPGVGDVVRMLIEKALNGKRSR